MARSSFRSAYGLSLKKTDEERERKRREQIFALAKEHGLKTPEEEPKENIPLLARVFDITSRLEYGISQSIIEQKEAATKSFQERVIAGPKGFIAGITGKKKARAEDVLKKLGIGEAPLITTPKVTTPNIPFLGKLTFGGKITGRGLASLPLSIVADPITYLSIGTGSAAKLTLKNGATVALNKPGRTALTNEIKQVIKQSTKEGTELSGMQVRELAERKIRDLIEASPKKYVDFGGIKFAGKTILPEAQQKIGRKVAETGIPERVKEITARTLAPIVPGAKLKAQGYGDFFERVRDTQRQPNLIRKGSVEQAIDFFQKETGKMPSQAQLEEFFDLADKGIPIDVAKYIPPEPLTVVKPPVVKAPTQVTKGVGIIPPEALTVAERRVMDKTRRELFTATSQGDLNAAESLVEKGYIKSSGPNIFEATDKLAEFNGRKLQPPGTFKPSSQPLTSFFKENYIEIKVGKKVVGVSDGYIADLTNPFTKSDINFLGKTRHAEGADKAADFTGILNNIKANTDNVIGKVAEEDLMGTKTMSFFRTAEGKTLALNEDFISYFKKRYGDGIELVAGKDAFSAVRVDKGGKVVGTIMPVKSDSLTEAAKLTVSGKTIAPAVKKGLGEAIQAIPPAPVAPPIIPPPVTPETLMKTPIIMEVGGELPESFIKLVDDTVTDPAVNSLYKRYLTDIRPALRGMALDLGLPEDKLLHDYIFRGIAGKEKKATTGIVSPFKLKKPSQLKARTAPEFTGIEKNPVFAIAQSLAELRVASVNNRFITETLEKYGIKKAKGALIPEGFIEYQPKGALGFFPVTTDAGKNVAAVTKKVPTYYVPEEIGKTLNKLTSTTDVHSFLKLYDKTLRIWKGGVTSLFPAFHIRNWTGNIYNNWLGGVNDIDSYVDALKLQSGRDISVMGFSKHELRDSLEELGIVRTGFYGKDIESLLDDVLKTEATDTSKLIRALTKTKTLKEKTLDPVISFPRAIGTVIEDNGKIAHFVSKLKQGLSPREAAASVRKYLFDYTDLTDFEKQVMRRIFPFYTWIRKDIPLQIESLVRTPGKPAAVGDIINALPKGDKSDLGGLPDYIKEGFFVSLGAGKFAYSLSTLPIEDINRLFRGGVARTAERELIGAVAPAISLPLKLLAGKNFFYNQSYDDYAYTAGKQAFKSKLTKPLLNWLEYREEKFTLKSGPDEGKEITRHWVNPSKWEFLNSTPFTRILTTSTSDDPFVQAVSPIKVREFDIKLGKKIREQEEFNEFEQDLVRRGLLKEFTRTFIPKEEEEENYFATRKRRSRSNPFLQ